MKEQPILGYDWEMGHEEIKLEIGTYYTGKGFYKDHPELEEQSQVPKKKKRNQMER